MPLRIVRFVLDSLAVVSWLALGLEAQERNDPRVAPGT